MYNQMTVDFFIIAHRKKCKVIGHESWTRVFFAAAGMITSLQDLNSNEIDASRIDGHRLKKSFEGIIESSPTLGH